MFSYSHGCREQNALKVVVFVLVLNFDNDDLVFAVRNFQVEAVGFLAGEIPVALAFKYRQNLDVILEQLRQKPFEDVEVNLAAQQSFNCPVETDQSAWFCHRRFPSHNRKIGSHNQYSFIAAAGRVELCRSGQAGIYRMPES